MGFSNETQERIIRFAREQSRRYLDDAEMTYMEKLREKTGQTKQKIGKKLSRFRGRSDQSREAENDMVLYMSDYMDDLISRGMTESEAFEKARDELSDSGEASPHSELRERIHGYYESRDPADYEAIGVIYGGCTVIGMVIGALIGYVLSGGRSEFMTGGWIDTLIGCGVGILIGVGLGQLGHAVMLGKRRR